MPAVKLPTFVVKMLPVPVPPITPTTDVVIDDTMGAVAGSVGSRTAGSAAITPIFGPTRTLLPPPKARVFYTDVTWSVGARPGT